MLVDVLVELGTWTVKASYTLFLFSAGLAFIGALAIMIALLFGGLR
jgi:hypothetical protein